jgi:ABC-type nitrate/sulfonate/bicarbonate transport system substrate-binding protein
MSSKSGSFDRRKMLATLGGGGALLASGMPAGLLGGRAWAATKDITFVTPFGFLIGFAPVMYAVSGGFFKKEGLNVTIQGGKGSAVAVQQVLSGQAMFSRTGGVDLLRAAHGKGAPVTAIATVTQASPLFMISAAGAPINGPEDMKGKTIGVTSKGGLAENLLDMILESAGISAKTVAREAVGNAPGAFALIGEKRISAYIASMGTVVQLRQANQPIVAWNTDKYAPIPGQVYITRNEVIEKEPETVTAFLRAVNGSMNAIFAAKELTPLLESMRIFQVRDLQDLKVAELALRAEMDLFAADGQSNLLRNVPKRWQGALDAMAKVGLLTAGDASKYYTNKFIDAVKG